MNEESSTSIKLAIIDDHPLIRESLSLFLSKVEGIDVIGTYDNADDGIREVKKLKPDVALIDIEMPGRCPFEAIRSAKTEHMPTSFLFLSAYLSDSYIQEVSNCGASGYILKSSPIDQIVRAVRIVANGSQYFGNDVEKRFIPASQNRSGRFDTNESRKAALTNREIEVLRYIARGHSVKEIANFMRLSARTVDRHKANIMEKLNIHNQVGLARYAIAEGYSDVRTTLQPLTNNSSD